MRIAGLAMIGTPVAPGIMTMFTDGGGGSPPIPMGIVVGSPVGVCAMGTIMPGGGVEASGRAGTAELPPTYVP